MVKSNGEYGSMGDLGMHVVHLPFRAGWRPRSVRALLSKVVKERPNQAGQVVPCETWDNAILACEGIHLNQSFPMVLSFKRIMPGHSNTWFLKIYGTALSAEFSTQYPKHLRLLPYTPGGAQEWRLVETQHRSAYDVITGGIFEFGFSDAMLQMISAYCDELAHGQDGMRQPLYCATPEETALSHALFTAALESHKREQVVKISSETAT
jgi:predicted dehydrogenase